MTSGWLFVIKKSLQRQLSLSYHTGDEITPLDGRNRCSLLPLVPFFSDRSLNSFRVFVEVEYLKKLSTENIIRHVTTNEIVILDNLSRLFGEKEYKTLREIEKETNHDMQAVVLFIQRKLQRTTLKDVAPMVHFALTSDDINNLAYALMIRNSTQDVLIPELHLLEKELRTMSKTYKHTPLLGKTHGQYAVPTTFGKELMVYTQRLSRELIVLKKHKIRAKLNGNVGNFNAHTFVFPLVNWVSFSKTFITSLGLTPDLVTTQIEPYDSLIFLFQTLSRINSLLSGLCQDMWLYISAGYCTQRVVQKEVGSTALPHKVNPIYFEGGEGGFGIANALFNFYGDKLSYSRLQRDLSDSIVRRSFSIAFSYSLLSYKSVREGLLRIEPNTKRMNEELRTHFEILSEAVQNMLRARGVYKAYNTAKAFFRGKEVNRDSYREFVQKLPLSLDDKIRLINLTPETYTGVAEKLVSL